VSLHDGWHVLRRNAVVPDVVRVDEYDRPLVVAAGAGVAQHRGRREPAPLDLGAEDLEELDAAPGAAAPLPRRSAHEDLSKVCHCTNSMRHRG
jgi:hypothetical protein